MSRRIGALTISQSPRRDLLAPLVAAFSEYDIIEAGALDFADINNMPDGSDAYYPLTTTLNNGDLVTLDRDFLTPLLQEALANIESQDVVLTILLCAGDFPDLKASRPLIKPGYLVQQTLRAMNMKRILVISPIDIQCKPIKDKWIKAGFDPLVWTMKSTLPQHQALWINTQLKMHDDGISCIVLDYVGYPSDSIQILQREIDIPIFDLGHLAIAAMKTLV